MIIIIQSLIIKLQDNTITKEDITEFFKKVEFKDGYYNVYASLLKELRKYNKKDLARIVILYIEDKYLGSLLNKNRIATFFYYCDDWNTLDLEELNFFVEIMREEGQTEVISRYYLKYIFQERDEIYKGSSKKTIEDLISQIDYANLIIYDLFELFMTLGRYKDLLREKLKSIPDSSVKTYLLNEPQDQEDTLAATNKYQKMINYSKAFIDFDVTIEEISYIEEKLGEQPDYEKPNLVLFKIHRYYMNHKEDSKFAKIYEKLFIPHYIRIKDLKQDETIDLDKYDYISIEKILKCIIKYKRYDIRLIYHYNYKDDINKLLHKYYKKFKYKNIFIDFRGIDGEGILSIEEYDKAIRFYEETALFINRYGFSPGEKLVVNFFLTKIFKKYRYYRDNYEKDQKYDNMSRNPFVIIKNPYIVCAGYSNFMIELSERIGLNTKHLGSTHDSGRGHARTITHLKDEKYDVDVVVISDPTYCNDKLYNFMFLVAPPEDIQQEHFGNEQSKEELKNALKDLFPDLPVEESLKKLDYRIDRGTLLQMINNVLEKIYPRDQDEEKREEIYSKISDTIPWECKLSGKEIKTNTKIEVKYCADDNGSLYLYFTHPKVNEDNIDFIVSQIEPSIEKESISFGYVKNKAMLFIQMFNTRKKSTSELKEIIESKLEVIEEIINKYTDNNTRR